MDSSAFSIADLRIESAEEAQKIQDFSSLPPELLDYIFELVAESYQLPTAPPSKHLLPSHERALYRYIRISNYEQLDKLASTLEAHPGKGQYTTRFEWGRGWEDFDRVCMPHKACLKRIFERLPNLLEMNFEERTQLVAVLFGIEPDLRALVPSLTTYRFVESEIKSRVVEALGKIPHLRRIEVSYTNSEEILEEEEEKQHDCKAPQVVEVAIVCRNYGRNAIIWNPSRLVRFFPDAKFVSLDIDIRPWNRTSSAIKLVENLPPDFRSLEIRNRVDESLNHPPGIDRLLPRLSQLKHLHLDPPLYSFQNLCDNLPSVKSLVSLSLAFSNNLHDPISFAEAVQRLPSLRVASFEYFPITEGDLFDIELAEAQAEETGFVVGDFRTMRALDGVDDMAEMTGWHLPFDYDSSETLLQVIEMEKKIEEVGIVVNSNLEVVRRAFHRQLVEYFNLAIGGIYFHHFTENLDKALHLARLYNFLLPPLEIDLQNKDLLKMDKLEWFRVDLPGVMEDGGKECRALNLRYKKETARGENERI